MVMQPYYERDGISIYVGDNREVLPHIEPVHAVVTDPPYGLSFMGKGWDHQVPGVEFWQAIGEAVLPGAHLLAFGGTRTYHRMAVAIEDAGYEIRDTLQWLYGSGFPKSHDISKAIDKMDAADVRRERQLRFTRWMRSTGLTSAQIDRLTGTNMGGHYTTLASQPAVATRDHFEKLRPHISVDVPQWVEQMVDERTVESENFKRREVIGQVTKGSSPLPNNHDGRWNDGQVDGTFNLTAPATPEAEQWQGWGTALKPAYEPIIMARLPFKGTVAANVLAHGTGAINVDASRIGTGDNLAREGGGFAPWSLAHGGQKTHNNMGIGVTTESHTAGRWPANVILDEAAAEALDAQSGERPGMPRTTRRTGTDSQGYGGGWGRNDASMSPGYGDTGGASRFFYVAKASRRERNAGLEGMPEVERQTQGRDVVRTIDRRDGKGPVPVNAQIRPAANHHPTVKPLALMRYLIQMITPPGGIILDPFAGSGSTLVAAAELGFNAIGVELSEEYAEIAARRVDHALNERAGKLPLELAAD